MHFVFGCNIQYFLISLINRRRNISLGINQGDVNKLDSQFLKTYKQICPTVIYEQHTNDLLKWAGLTGRPESNLIGFMNVYALEWKRSHQKRLTGKEKRRILI